MWRSLAIARTTTSPELRPTRTSTVTPWVRRSVFGQPAHRALQVDGGVAGAHRVVLVGERRAEEGHDPVAHDLVHGPLVAVNGLHHPLEDRIQQLPGLLGVPVGEELHRALHVREEHRDLLALAFERGLRGEDLLGQVLGGVRVGRGEAGLTSRPWPRDRVRALQAELGRGWELGPAALTDTCQG